MIYERRGGHSARRSLRRSLEAPLLESVTDKLGVGRLEAGAAELEGQAVGGRVEQRDVLGRQPPAERSGVLTHLHGARRAGDRDRALADDPVERDLRGRLAVARRHLVQHEQQRLDAAVGHAPGGGRELEPARLAAFEVAKQLAPARVAPLAEGGGRELAGEETHREEVVGEARDAELVARLHRGERPLAAVEQVEVDLVGREWHASLREVLVAAGEQRGAVVRDADVLSDAAVVALGQPIPVRLNLLYRRQGS